MMGVWSVARRELFSLWVTPLAWLLLCSFLLMNGAAFIATLGSMLAFGSNGIDVGPLQAYYGQSIFIPLGYLLVCPLLSMRTLAEERRSGTAELLLSAPISSTGIVVGKYLALAITYVGMWLPTLLYPFILRDTGQVEWAVVATTYLGVIGLGLGFIGVGLLSSALAANQLVAAVTSGTLIFLLMLCGVGEQVYQEGPLHTLLSHLSIQSHLTECAQGILSLRRLAYLATLIVLPLFLAARAVERWREA
jgi:ABC-2 type transport system permease protein